MELAIDERPLTTGEATRLKELETVIRDNFLAYVAVGQALLEIRENRLYRTNDGRTWEGYCRELLDMSHQRADQLIAAKAVVDNLTTIVVKDDGSPDWELLPANEAQARELAKLQPEEQREVWRQLIEERGCEAAEGQTKVTAKAVKNAVKALKGDRFSKLANKLKDALKPRAKADPNRVSDEFSHAWRELVEQVEDEHRLGWKNTSRAMVFQALMQLAADLGDTQQTMKDKKITFRTHNLEKLVAAGWSVLRRDKSALRIEQLGDDGEWMTLGEYDTESQCEDAFREALLEPNSIHA